MGAVGAIQEDFLEEVMPDVVVDGQVGKGILGQRLAGAWSRAGLSGVWGGIRIYSAEGPRAGSGWVRGERGRQEPACRGHERLR